MGRSLYAEVRSEGESACAIEARSLGFGKEFLLLGFVVVERDVRSEAAKVSGKVAPSSGMGSQRARQLEHFDLRVRGR